MVKPSYTWVINVGIGAMNDIIYIGGRSQSLQASANPAERGDMLQGFSKWDKYVGIVANNNERTVQQYWSEFSGYTMYVDVPTGEKKLFSLKMQKAILLQLHLIKTHLFVNKFSSWNLLQFIWMQK